MSIQEYLIKLSPDLLRKIRALLTLEMNMLLSNIPDEGLVLDIGCGIGSVDYEIARRKPRLKIIAIDVEDKYIKLGKRFNSQPNVLYKNSNASEINDLFDCVFMIDIFHHLPPENKGEILHNCRRLLKANGYIFIKDIAASKNNFSYFMDKHVSRCKELFYLEPPQLKKIISDYFDVYMSEERFRFPFSHYYIKAKLKQ